MKKTFELVTMILIKLLCITALVNTINGEYAMASFLMVVAVFLKQK